MTRVALLVGLATLAATAWFVARFASPIPFADDLGMAPAMAPDFRVSLEWLWSQHNEHRIPLPRAVYLGLFRLLRDVRAAMFLEVAILGAASFALVRAARFVRGRGALADAFFPLLLLHWGNAENLLMGFQIAVTIPVAAVCAFLALVAASPRLPAPRAAAGIGACLVVLPLCGGSGLTQAPPLLLWAALLGLRNRVARDASTRRSARILLAGAALSASIGALYLVGFERPPGAALATSPVRVATAALQFLSLSIGPVAEDLWPFSAVILVLPVLAAAAALVRALRGGTRDGSRAAGILACMASVALMALAVALGRAGMTEAPLFATRFVMLPAPILAAAFLGMLACAPPRIARIGTGGLCAVMLLLLPLNARTGVRYGRTREHDHHLVAVDVARGMAPLELAERHHARLLADEVRCAWMLLILQRHGLPPFGERRGAR